MDRIQRAQNRVAQACKRADSPTALFTAVQAALAPDMPADRWCAMTLDPATAIPTGGLHEHGLSAHLAPRLLELEFAGGDVNLLADLARSRQPVATLSSATEGSTGNSTRYREVLQPDGLQHEVRAVFRDSHGPWAALILFRGGDVRDFDGGDVSLLSAISEPVTHALRRILLLAEMETQHGNEAPGLLMLEGEGTLHIAHASASAREWLAQVEDGSTSHLPYALYSLAQRARGAGHAVARIRTRAGRWLTAHAESAADGGISLILQPSRPHEIAQVLAAAYGLTPRESEVARLVAAGCGNAEIAKLLFVSRYTVEDHLKNSYGKLGVGSRAELVSRLFFDQYLPRTTPRPQLDGQGWFLQPPAGIQPR